MRAITKELQLMNNLMGHMVGHLGTRQNACNDIVCSSNEAKWNAVFDVSENANEVAINIELPGAEKSNIEVNALDNGVEVKEHSKGFYRFFRLSKDVLNENAKASYKNGILELKIPKKERMVKEIKVE